MTDGFDEDEETLIAGGGRSKDGSFVPPSSRLIIACFDIAIV